MSIIEKAVERLQEESLELPPEDGGGVDQAALAEGGEHAARDGRSLQPPPPAAGEEGPRPAVDLQERTGGEAARERPKTRPAGDPAPGAPARTTRSVALDLATLHNMGVMTPDTSNTLIAEQYRVIKRPLLMQAVRHGSGGIEHGNLIMVASALPGEGKTHTALNLAMSIATERDRTVLVIDCDFQKADLSRILGLHPADGLADYLHSEKMALSEVLVKTDIPKVLVLPAGNRHTHVTELLAGEHMKRLVDDLSARYSDRVVIFDSPPLLASAGAVVLASLVGQIALVVEAVRTPESALREALRLLGPMENVGVILNKSRERLHKSYYRYGHGYGYYGGY